FALTSTNNYVTSCDVPPISMSPISQSQFIPLGEVLLLAISAMNSAHKSVTQETLTEHLQTCFPGVPTPSEEVLHHTLSMLVHERKICPTPNGYLNITPQTYFIKPSLIQTSSWYRLGDQSTDRQQQQYLSGTVTPFSSGAVRDRAYPKSSQNYSGGGGGSSSHLYNYRGEEPSSHQHPSAKEHWEVHTPAQSAQTPPQQAGVNTEKTRSAFGFSFKMDTFTKPRGGGKGGRKFGLKLFRLSFKKEKAKQLATFSAQFPPEEWPLHDEEAPSPLPWPVEMEIIRRINPDLTVENLARHTAVMKRLEEERAQRSKVSSANQSSRSRRSGGRHRKQSQAKVSHSHSKARAPRGAQPIVSWQIGTTNRTRRRLPGRPENTLWLLSDRGNRLHLAHSNPNILDSSHLPSTPEWDVSGELAKRRTEMPFPEPSHGPTTHFSKVHRSLSHTQERKSRNERSVKAKERSRSMDNSKGSFRAGLIGPPDYHDRNRYYTDTGTLRTNQSSSHSHVTTPSSKFLSESLGLDGCRSLEKSKSIDSVTPYSPKLMSGAVQVDEYLHSTASSEAVLSTANPLLLRTLGKSSNDRAKLENTDRQADAYTSHLLENKEEASKMGINGGSLPPIPLSIPDAPPSNGQIPHSASSVQEKQKEIFSKDTLFKPPPSLPLPGYGSLRKAPVITSFALSSSCDAIDSLEDDDAPKPLVAAPVIPPQAVEPTNSGAEASFDYYNVSEDEEPEEGEGKGQRDGDKAGERVVGRAGSGAGTMQWLLEREKEMDLQRKFEKTLTFPGTKENIPEPSQNQHSAHSARLDSMDSSSVNVDSGFNSPRTRESLASNTSSILESNRRQNLALSPGHIGITAGNGAAFSFRTVPEPPAAQTEKVQKPNNCLASITSV
uniref:Storkhead box 2 n=1 Tax=Tetraodon nigroviridis TaxID=99883 RepID=H3CJY1_TETNG